MDRFGCSAMNADRCGAMCLRPKAVGAVRMRRPEALFAPTESASYAERSSPSSRLQSS